MIIFFNIFPSYSIIWSVTSWLTAVFLMISEHHIPTALMHSIMAGKLSLFRRSLDSTTEESVIYQRFVKDTSSES